MDTIWTDPGCDAATHRLEVMGAALMWDHDCKFPLPSLMECGCWIVAIGDDEPAGWEWSDASN